MPRFVLLRHECPESFGKPSHWDFMLEWGKVLRTWDLRELPAAWAAALEVAGESKRVPAFPLDDHRLVYLEFEGPLSGDRGYVRRGAQGTYELLLDSEEAVELVLAGDQIAGKVNLEKHGRVWHLAAGESTTSENR